MGTSPDDSMLGFDEKPLAVVEVPSFCIDGYEYPNKRGVLPMVAVGWADAKRQCESQNKRLCSEAEWEKSCKGPGGSRWPYGNAFDASVCATEDDTGESRPMAPSGKFAKCRSGYGVADLSGNASEWTAEKMIKGGSYASSDYAVRCSARKNGAAFAKSSEVGFRCCADPK
jgi:formylglycine-generating enzyme required for sulfatase activity